MKKYIKKIAFWAIMLVVMVNLTVPIIAQADTELLSPLGYVDGDVLDDAVDDKGKVPHSIKAVRLIGTMEWQSEIEAKEGDVLEFAVLGQDENKLNKLQRQKARIFIHLPPGLVYEKNPAYKYRGSKLHMRGESENDGEVIVKNLTEKEAFVVSFKVVADSDINLEDNNLESMIRVVYKTYIPWWTITLAILIVAAVIFFGIIILPPLGKNQRK